MRRRIYSKTKIPNNSEIGILILVPLLVFCCGIILISAASYNYIKSAFYLSRLFIHSEFKPATKKTLEVKGRKINFPDYGEEFGELSIESASITSPVINGDGERELLKGIGHYTGSSFPGEGSNVLLAGHANLFLGNLYKAVEGDTVILDTTYGKYIYKIGTIKVIDRNDNSIAQPSEKEILTIYTCYPFDYIGDPPQRYVIICNLIEGTPLKELQYSLQ
jgi:sortase A